MTMKGKSAGEQFSEMFNRNIGGSNPKRNYGDTSLN